MNFTSMFVDLFMNKILIVLIATFLFSCKNWQNVSRVTDRVYIGMHVDEFLQVANKRYEKDAMNTEYYVYRVSRYDWYSGMLRETMFYYFDNKTDKLIEVNSGTQKIEIN